MPSLVNLFNRFHAAGKNEDLLKYAIYGWGQGIHNKPMSLPIGKAQLVGCLKVWLGSQLEWDAGNP